MKRSDFTFKETTYYQNTDFLNETKYGPRFITVILSFIVLALIAVYIVRYSDGGFTVPTFSSLLEMLSNVPDISISLETIVPISLDWGVFNFLRDFFNVFVKLFNLVLWIADNLLICLEYIFYFLRWIFVG